MHVQPASSFASKSCGVCPADAHASIPSGTHPHSQFACVGGVLLAMIEGLQIFLTKMMAEPSAPPYAPPAQYTPPPMPGQQRAAAKPQGELLQG